MPSSVHSACTAASSRETLQGALVLAAAEVPAAIVGPGEVGGAVLSESIGELGQSSSMTLSEEDVVGVRAGAAGLEEKVDECAGGLESVTISVVPMASTIF